MQKRKKNDATPFSPFFFPSSGERALECGRSTVHLREKFPKTFGGVGRGGGVEIEMKGKKKKTGTAQPQRKIPSQRGSDCYKSSGPGTSNAAIL